MDDAASEEKRYMAYMLIILTDIAVLHSFLAEIDPQFIVCHDFDRAGEEAAASRVARFVAPDNTTAEMFGASLVTFWMDHPKVEERLQFEGANQVAARLQRKLDLLDSIYCKNS